MVNVCFKRLKNKTKEKNEKNNKKWKYRVYNVEGISMVTVLYRHKSHIAITILWKILYYQGHHTLTLHSTKCES